MSAISLVSSFHLTCSLLDLLRTIDAGAWPLAEFFVVASCALCGVQEGDLGALEGQQKKIALVGELHKPRAVLERR